MSDTENAPALQTKLELDYGYDYENDPSLQLSNQRVKEAREAVTAGTDRVYRIYTDGIFDLFHVGHMNMLKQAKHALGNPKNVHLIAGICSDADTLQHKGKLVMDEATRLESVSHCKWVDQTIEHAPWVISDEFLEKHQIDFVAHDAIPYNSAGSEDVYAGVKRKGKFLATARTQGISTTDLIVQIVKDYDIYVIRNLQRGIDKKQLNVGRTWEIRAVAHQKEKNLDEKLKLLDHERTAFISSLKSLADTVRNNPNLCLRGGPRSHANGVDCGANTLANPSLSTSVSEEESSSAPSRSPNTISEVDTQDDYAYNKPSDIDNPGLYVEASKVIKHSFLLTKAVVLTSCSALSYFNIFSYIDMCRQTRRYSKKDE